VAGKKILRNGISSRRPDRPKGQVNPILVNPARNQSPSQFLLLILPHQSSVPSWWPQQASSAGDSSFPRDLEQGVAPLRGRISFLRRRSRRRRPPLVSFLRSSSGCSGVVSQSICLPVLSIVMRLFLCVPAWLSFSLDETANSFLRFSFLVLGGGLWILEILRI
jgi:hypothetical protein